MTINVQKTKKKKTNYFITTEEAKILWQYADRWNKKFRVMLGFALFRGMRIGEICAINLYDFQNDKFQKLNIIFEKSHVQDDMPILKEFNILLKEYIMKNKHLMKDGYLFPYYTSKKKTPYMNPLTAQVMFCKLRHIIGKDYPQFLNRTEILTKKGGIQYRYRISFHSCRRWFETQLWDKHKDKMLIRDIMRYRDSKVVDVYIDPYENWKNEDSLLEETFGSLFSEFNHVSKGQTKLTGVEFQIIPKTEEISTGEDKFQISPKTKESNPFVQEQQEEENAVKIEHLSDSIFSKMKLEIEELKEKTKEFSKVKAELDELKEKISELSKMKSNIFTLTSTVKELPQINLQIVNLKTKMQEIDKRTYLFEKEFSLKSKKNNEVKGISNKKERINQLVNGLFAEKNNISHEIVNLSG